MKPVSEKDTKRRNPLFKSSARWSLLLCLEFLAVGALSCSTMPTAPPAPDPEALAVLFVGNSLTYSNNLPGLLKHLLEVAQDNPLHMEAVALPDYGLPDHRIRPSTASTDHPKGE